MSIEAEQKLLVDTPFHCVGIAAVGKKSFDLEIDPYVISDDKAVVLDKVREVLKDSEIDYAADDKLNLTYDKLKKVIAEGTLHLKQIDTCEIEVYCNDRDDLKNFQREHNGNYIVKYGKYTWGDTKAPLTLKRIKDVSQIDDFVEDLNADDNLTFIGGRFRPQDMECRGIAFVSYKLEIHPERTKRIKLLNGKEMAIFEGKVPRVVGYSCSKRLWI